MMVKWFLSQGIGLLPILLPFILPNKWLYAAVRKTIGKVVAAISMKTKDSPWKALAGWITNTIVTCCSAISDEVRGIPMEGKSGITASKFAASPPAPPAE